MRLARFRRLVAAMMRVSVAEAAAYRAESIIWLFATSMPLVMLSLFGSVAREAPVGRFDETRFIAYFLCTFIVRTTTGSWAAWQLNMDIRDGTLAVRLLRPAPPLLGYATENIAALPLRAIVSVPIALAMLAGFGGAAITRDLGMWLVVVLAMLGAWLSNLFTNLAIGCLAFFFESSIKLIGLYIAAFFVLSGYMIPIEIFTPEARKIIDYLPFHFQLGFPVEVATGAHSPVVALHFLAVQWLYVGLGALATSVLLRRGLRRFAAYGG